MNPFFRCGPRSPPERHSCMLSNKPNDQLVRARPAPHALPAAVISMFGSSKDKFLAYSLLPCFNIQLRISFHTSHCSHRLVAHINTKQLLRGDRITPCNRFSNNKPHISERLALCHQISFLEQIFLVCSTLYFIKGVQRIC